MDFPMDDPFDFDSFINWPDDLAPALDAAEGEDGVKHNARLSFAPIAWPMTPEPLETATFGHAQSLGEAIPGYGTDNATNEGPTRVTTTPIPSPADLEPPNLGQESSSASRTKGCGCIVCHEIGTYVWNSRGYSIRCLFASCNQLFAPYPHASYHLAMHERNHYRRGPANPQPPFSCLVENCRFTSKRWPDLRRHTSAKHCNNPAKLACSVIGCKYSGEGNGFTRKDKLIAHFKSMHQGQKMPGKAVRAIKPAPASSHAEASGSSSMSA